MIMWFLAPPKHCTRLPVGAAARIDVLRDRRRADEADGLDVGIVEDGVDHFLVAVDDVEDAGRQAGLDEQFGNAQRHARIALGRLQDEGVAAGDRRRDLPQRDHGREVERGDAGDDAERLAHRIDVDAGAGAVGELALHHVRRADADLDHFQAALDVALGVGDGLAVLARQDFGQLVIVALRPVRGTSSARARGAAGWSPPRPAAPPWRSRPPRAVRPCEASATVPRTVPSIGCMTSCLRPLVAGDALAADEMPVSRS